MTNRVNHYNTLFKIMNELSLLKGLKCTNDLVVTLAGAGITAETFLVNSSNGLGSQYIPDAWKLVHNVKVYNPAIQIFWTIYRIYVIRSTETGVVNALSLED
jgi:hypothetical protein